MTDKNAIIALLDDMEAKLTAELQTVGIHNPENPSDWIAIPQDLDAEEPDENLAADNVEAWNERVALVATLEQQYNGVKRARARIEAGTFGICEICNAPIEEKRLVANPIARTCMAHMNDESTLST